MEMVEAFWKAVSLSTKGTEESLNFLGLSKAELEKLIKKKKTLKEGKNFDLVFDFKPKLNQIILYLTTKKWSKKLSKKLNPSHLDFKSTVILLGSVELFGKIFELRLGAFGVSTSDLIRANVKK